MTKFYLTIDKHAPLKTKFVQVRPKAPWMTSEVINERRIKRNEDGGIEKLMEVAF